MKQATRLPRKVKARIQDPWLFSAPSIEEARALQAIAVGAATSEQQKVGLGWIRRRACGAGLDTFAAGQPDLSHYRQGRQSVAVLITQVLLTKPENWRQPGETDV